MRVRSATSAAATNSAPRIVAWVKPVPAYSALETMKAGRPSVAKRSVKGAERCHDGSSPSVSHPRS